LRTQPLNFTEERVKERGSAGLAKMPLERQLGAVELVERSSSS